MEDYNKTLNKESYLKEINVKVCEIKKKLQGKLCKKINFFFEILQGMVNSE